MQDSAGLLDKISRPACHCAGKALISMSDGVLLMLSIPCKPLLSNHILPGTLLYSGASDGAEQWQAAV